MSDWNEEPTAEDFKPEDFEALLDLADRVGDLPLGPRHAEMILQHRRFRKLGRLFVLYFQGYKEGRDELLKLVARLHECYRETSPGHFVVKVGAADARIERHRELIDYLRTLEIAPDDPQATH